MLSLRRELLRHVAFIAVGERCADVGASIVVELGLVVVQAECRDLLYVSHADHHFFILVRAKLDVDIVGVVVVVVVATSEQGLHTL